MKRTILAMLVVLRSGLSYGQDDFAQRINNIYNEGKLLYRLEKASWLGGDIFREKHPDLSNTEGYFSYLDKDTVKNVVFSKELSPKVICTVSFDTNLNTAMAGVSMLERDFTSTEREIFILRSRALAAVQSDNFFKTYDHTNLNLVPVIYNSQKKVYILTAPTENGILVFGNDYLLSFDDSSKLVSRKKLHQNIILAPYEGKDVVVGMHTHLATSGDLMTATDICTIMLYEKFVPGMKQYIVISPDYTSKWDCERDELSVKRTGPAKKQPKKNKKKHTDRDAFDE